MAARKIKVTVTPSHVDLELKGEEFEQARALAISQSVSGSFLPGIIRGIPFEIVKPYNVLRAFAPTFQMEGPEAATDLDFVTYLVGLTNRPTEIWEALSAIADETSFTDAYLAAAKIRQLAQRTPPA